MSKPYIHSVSSAKKFGGIPEEYQKYHDWFDQTKSLIADNRHRALLHTSFGIFLFEQVFGTTFVNSSGRTVSLRDIGEQHVLEDHGGKFIPSAQDYLQEIEYKDWMAGTGHPTSYERLENRKVSKRKIIISD